MQQVKKNEKNEKPKKNRGGRPTKAPEDRKKVQLKIWVTPADAAAIKKKAESEGFKYSGQFMSRAIREAVNGTAPIIKLNPAAMRALGQVGNNLNQIAKHLNSGGEFHKDMLQHVLSARETTKYLWQEIVQLKIKKSKQAAK